MGNWSITHKKENKNPYDLDLDIQKASKVVKHKFRISSSYMQLKTILSSLPLASTNDLN